MQPATAPLPPAPPPRRNPARVFLLVLLLVAAAFGAGYVPQWLAARNLRSALATTELQLRLVNLHDRLGVASHEAQRNNFANAAESARRFFDECATLANSDVLGEDARTKVALLGYVSQRDEVMALLAAGDPAARERLAALYLTMESVLERRGAAQPM